MDMDPISDEIVSMTVPKPKKIKKQCRYGMRCTRIDDPEHTSMYDHKKEVYEEEPSRESVEEEEIMTKRHVSMRGGEGGGGSGEGGRGISIEDNLSSIKQWLNDQILLKLRTPLSAMAKAFLLDIKMVCDGMARITYEEE
jgi:hypothetical protein